MFFQLSLFHEVYPGVIEIEEHEQAEFLNYDLQDCDKQAIKLENIGL